MPTPQILRLRPPDRGLPTAFPARGAGPGRRPRPSRELHWLVGRVMLRTSSLPFRPEKYSGELYVHVPQAVDDGHACALKDLPRFRRCRPGDQQQRRVLRKMACVFDELPGGSRVGLPLRLQFYDIGDAAGPDDKSGPSVVGRSFSHAYLGDVRRIRNASFPNVPSIFTTGSLFTVIVNMP